MAAHWIFINSPRYRAFVEASKTNRLLFWGVTGGLAAAGGMLAAVVSGLTNPDYAAEGVKDKSDQVAKLALQDQVRAPAACSWAGEEGAAGAAWSMQRSGGGGGA